MMKSQRSDIEGDELIKDGIKMGTDEIITQNERINNNLQRIIFVCGDQLNLYCDECDEYTKTVVALTLYMKQVTKIKFIPTVLTAIS